MELYLVGVLICIITITVLVMINIYRDKHPVSQIEIYTEQKTINQAEFILKDDKQEKVSLWFDEERTTADTKYFQDGVSLFVAVTNKSDVDRFITCMNIHATDIVNDNRPKLVYSDSRPGKNDLSIYFKNEGWGAADNLQIRLVSFDNDDISLKKGIVDTFHVERIESGEDKLLLKLNYKAIDFKKVYLFTVEVFLRIGIYYDGIIEELIFLIPIHVNSESFQRGPLPCLMPERNYCIVIPTKESTFDKDYPVYQVIPAHKSVLLPVFVIPERSCTLSLSIEFVFNGSETISTNRYYLQFEVLKYHNLERFVEYISGELIDWRTVIGGTRIYFPFKIVNEIEDCSRK